MQEVKKRVALLMGSFNPVHCGHLAVARYVLDRDLAEEVWLVVSPQNPFKNPEELAPFEDRLEMVRLALAGIGDPRLKACDAEAALPQPSYTVNTMRHLQGLYPDTQFIILAGSDIADQLPQWREAEELRRMVRFLIYPRNYGTASPEMAEAPMYEIDSTSVREAIAAGLPVGTGVIPEPVRDYIRDKNLYAMNKTIKQWTEVIEQAPTVANHYFERGRLHYQNNDFGKAMNDFNRALELDPGHTAARQMRNMTQAIFNFRNFDIYNP